MAYKFPTEGGCWFCYMDDGEMHFSIAGDTWFHMDCLYEELEAGNPEAEIIATEHNIPFTTKFPEPEDYYPDDDDDDIEPLCPECGSEIVVTRTATKTAVKYECIRCGHKFEIKKEW